MPNDKSDRTDGPDQQYVRTLGIHFQSLLLIVDTYSLNELYVLSFVSREATARLTAAQKGVHREGVGHDCRMQRMLDRQLKASRFQSQQEEWDRPLDGLQVILQESLGSLAPDWVDPSLLENGQDGM